MKTSILLIALLLTGCASRSTLDVSAIKAEQEARYSDRTIQVQTLPPGAIIDLNNNVVGVSPCTLTLKRCWDGAWPANSYNVQLLRARWTDGSYEEQKFLSTAPVPERVVFLHPIPSHIAPPPAVLSQR